MRYHCLLQKTKKGSEGLLSDSETDCMAASGVGWRTRLPAADQFRPDQKEDGP